MTTSPDKFSDSPDSPTREDLMEQAAQREATEPRLDDVGTDDRSRDNDELDPTATTPGGESDKVEPPD